jgi:O-antigen/teichoic acid export membrane protein
LPAVIGLALTADQFVRIVLGPQWETVVAPLRVLCLYVAFQSCQVLVSHLLLWTGQFRPVMWFSVLTAAALPLSMWFAVRHGLSAVAWMWATVYPLTNIPPIVLGFRTIEISFLAWLRALLPAGVACLGMSAAVLAVRASLGEELPLIARFAACVGVGALVYVAVVWFGFRARCLALWEFLRGIRRPEASLALALGEEGPAA